MRAPRSRHGLGDAPLRKGPAALPLRLINDGRANTGPNTTTDAVNALFPEHMTMPSARTRKELHALRAELAATADQANATPLRNAPPKPTRSRTSKVAPDTAGPADVAPEPEPLADADASAPGTLSELQALIQDLQEAVQDVTESAEKAVTAYPTVALASAFLMGVLVGRAWGR